MKLGSRGPEEARIVVSVGVVVQVQDVVVPVPVEGKWELV